MNKITIIGNVGQEPQVTINERTNAKWVKFSIADSKKGYTTKDGSQVPDRTTWFNCVAWENIANVIEKYVHKGDKVYIEGEVNINQYTNKAGATCKDVEISVRQLELLSYKPQQTQQPQQQVQPQQQPQQQYQQSQYSQYSPQMQQKAQMMQQTFNMQPQNEPDLPF